MDRIRKHLGAALALAALTGMMLASAMLVLVMLVGSAYAGESAQAGRRVFDRHCQGCHSGAAPQSLPVGPNLEGIYGAKAGTRLGGTHSRAMIASGIVWDRQTLRGFLSAPRREAPAALMPDGLSDPAEVEALLDYLETLR